MTHTGSNFGGILQKLKLKKAALKVYFFFFNGYKDTISYSRKKIIPGLARRRSDKGTYAVDLDSDWIGLGARIVKTLEVLLYCDERGLTPLIRFNYREKPKSKTDYFAELFHYRHKGEFSGVRYTNVRDLDELGWPEDYNKKLSLDTASTLFQKYLGFNPEVLEETDLFVRDNFSGKKVLGVHYRGTDKVGEAQLVTKEHLLEQINTLLKAKPSLELVFISTDDQKIILFLQQSHLPVPVICRQDAIRSDDGEQFHRKKESSKSVVNRDAIINMLLLSRCDFLLKTASILSDCSIIFNPAIETKVISFPISDSLTWWPATEIKSNQLRHKTDKN